MEPFDVTRLARQMGDQTHALDARATTTIPLAVTASALLFLGADLTDFWLDQLAQVDRPAKVLAAVLAGVDDLGVLGPLIDGLSGTGSDEAVVAIAKLLRAKGQQAIAHTDLHGVSDLLGGIYTELRSRSGQAAHGAFYTPQAVAGLMAAINTPPPGSTVNDPCCGSGVLLRTQARAITAAGHDLGSYRFVGNDLDPVAAALCFINLVAAGVEAPAVTVGNALAPESTGG
jgi:hypothetical protein